MVGDQSALLGKLRIFKTNFSSNGTTCETLLIKGWSGLFVVAKRALLRQC